MRYYFAILLLIIGTNTYGQYTIIANTVGQPATMLYIKKIKDTAPLQALNVTRMVKADNLCLRLQANCAHQNFTYVRVWDSLNVLMPMFGDTAHSTALQMDMKRLVVGTTTGTLTFFRDSIRGTGGGSINTNYTLPNGNVRIHYSLYVNTAAFEPTTNPIPFDMGGSANGLTTGLLASWAILARNTTVGLVSSRVQLYENSLAVNYADTIATNGMWVNTCLAGTNNRIVMKNGVAIDTRTTVGTSVNPGDLLLFRTGYVDANILLSNKAFRGVTQGRAITSTQAVSLTNAFRNSK